MSPSTENGVNSGLCVISVVGGFWLADVLVWLAGGPCMLEMVWQVTTLEKATPLHDIINILFMYNLYIYCVLLLLLISISAISIPKQLLNFARVFLDCFGQILKWKWIFSQLHM